MGSKGPYQQCKLILLGNGSVGKSSIIARFIDDGFSRMYKQTVGLDFFEKTLILPGDSSLQMQVWDIGGQSINSKMLNKYIYGSDVIFLCYDVTDPQSFADVNDWFSLIHEVFSSKEVSKCQKIKLPSIYLIGNKIDLLSLRKIPESKHKEFISQNYLDGGFFFSAQNGNNVLKTFYKVAGVVAGIPLSDFDLGFTEKVIQASITNYEDEGRTDIADQIEAEDLKAENQKLKSSCLCFIM